MTSKTFINGIERKTMYAAFKKKKPTFLKNIRNNEKDSHLTIASALSDIFPISKDAFWNIYKYIELVDCLEEKERIIAKAYSVEEELYKDEQNGLRSLSKLNFHICFENNYGILINFFTSICYEEEKSILYNILHNNEHWYKSLDYRFDQLSNQKECWALQIALSKNEDYAKTMLENLLLYLIDKNIILTDISKNTLQFMIDTMVRVEFENHSQHFQYSDMDKQFLKGRLWEDLCRKIATLKYKNIIYDNKRKTLTNGKIPDIIVDEGVLTDDKGRICFAELIIECKTSTYFYNNSLENYSNKKYQDYCNELQYWIMERSRIGSDTFIHNKEKHCFFEFFINDETLPESYKKEMFNIANINFNSEDALNILAPKIRDQVKKIQILENELMSESRKYIFKISQIKYTRIIISILIDITSKEWIGQICIRNYDDGEFIINTATLKYINELDALSENIPECQNMTIPAKSIVTFDTKIPSKAKGKTISITIGNNEFECVKINDKNRRLYNMSKKELGCDFYFSKRTEFNITTDKTILELLQ